MFKTWLKRNFYRIYYLKKRVTFGDNVALNLKNNFEGLNVIESGCKIVFSSVGLGSYVADNSIIKHTSIGKFCSIGSNVQTGLGIHPSSTYVSTHPAFFSAQRQAGFSFIKEGTFKEHKYADKSEKFIVSIGNDVWIGNDVIIMDGITIGDGAIVGAGAVVTKNVAPYAIVGGVPAKFIKYRFTEPQIRKMLKIQWWEWGIEKIKAHHGLFNDIEKFITEIG